MKFASLKETVRFLENQGELVRISDPVDPDLEMAEITRQVFDAQGPAILFENVKNSLFPALSNLMGTWERTVKIFEPQLTRVKAFVRAASDPGKAMRSIETCLQAFPAGVNALPIPTRSPKAAMHQCRISDLPMIRCWPDDGGAFILLPQVFSFHPDHPSLFRSNLGMYRVQISGNDYTPDEQIGMHYQIHRGIGIHHKAALDKGERLKVSIFIGGPPAHTLAAVMPLPENMPEIAFAGALAGRNFRYAVRNGHLISSDADFCITGTLEPGRTKPEGPFGDHLGYYSLTHPYPFLKVESVYHRKGAIFPFTVVGRPPQEDSHFGRLIHEITGPAVQKAVPGVTAVNAVDEAGVHPLLLAKAREGYLPYTERAPRELFTHASRILGTGQLSLAKYLMIGAHEDCPDLDINDSRAFFIHMLERLDFSCGLHFITRTTMDSLDYSTASIHDGSKLVMAAAGQRRRTLSDRLPEDLTLPDTFRDPRLAAPGIMVITGPGFSDYPSAAVQIEELLGHLGQVAGGMDSLPMLVISDDARFTARSFANFLWVTFTRSNPSHDIYGVQAEFVFKHWCCRPPMVIDARIKPFHAKALAPDPGVTENVKSLGRSGGPLHGII